MIIIIITKLLYLHAVGATEGADEADVADGEQQQRQETFHERARDAVAESKRRRLIQPA